MALDEKGVLSWYVRKMPVERALFLALTAALAGCNHGPDVAPRASAPPTSSAAPTASSPDAPKDAATFLRDVMESGRCRVLEKRTEGNRRPLTPMEQACVEIEIPYRPDWPACEGVEPWCRIYSEGLVAPLGARALACLRAKSGTRAICEKDVVTNCVEQVTASARVSAEVHGVCASMATQCAGRASVDVAACGRVVSSLGECSALAWVVGCVQTRCDVHACLANPW